MTTEELSAKLEAALVQLRAVEAERDEARNGVKKSAEAYGALMEHAEKLRAELERKDAALRDVDGNFDIYTTNVKGGVTLPRLQMEPCLEYAWRTIRAALENLENRDGK